MKITNTWKKRFGAARRGGGRALLALLVFCAAVQGISLLWRFFFPAAPAPVTPIARTVVNQSALIGSFATDCVTALLTGSVTTTPDLNRCFPNGNRYSLPTLPSMVVTFASPAAFVPGQSTEYVQTFGVIVRVVKQPYLNAPKIVSCYQIPVSVYNGTAPRAIDKIGPAECPKPGADVQIGYPATIPSDSALFSTLQGFITCYLTGSSGIERFTTADSAIAPVHPPTLPNPAAATNPAAPPPGSGTPTTPAVFTPTITGATATDNPPEHPAENSELSVHIDISFNESSLTPIDYALPLTMRWVDGNWYVAAIDSIPVLDQEAEPTPLPNAPTR